MQELGKLLESEIQLNIEQSFFSHSEIDLLLSLFEGFSTYAKKVYKFLTPYLSQYD